VRTAFSAISAGTELAHREQVEKSLLREVNFVPKNLVVRVPDGVPLEAASLSAIGAIALQGFRQSQAVLGEVVAVIGAGLVGVLTIQLAKAAGCRVIAIDRDLQRVERARQFGADLALGSSDGDMPARVPRICPLRS
jgi:threonine dehydrogenase-like Zn-dependent dehydrogenase